VNHKRKVFKKYKDERHPAYRKASREAALEIRRAKRSFEKKLAKNIDTDKRSFYAYVRSRARSKSTVGPLVDNSGDIAVLPQEMANKFNQYFASVFTSENLSDIPTADHLINESNCVKLLNNEITENIVKQKLDRLRPDKADGVDEISPRLLLELKDQICYPVATI